MHCAASALCAAPASRAASALCAAPSADEFCFLASDFCFLTSEFCFLFFVFRLHCVQFWPETARVWLICSQETKFVNRMQSGNKSLQRDAVRKQDSSTGMQSGNKNLRGGCGAGAGIVVRRQVRGGWGWAVAGGSSGWDSRWTTTPLPQGSLGSRPSTLFRQVSRRAALE